jgi:hypothetical protein
MFRRGRAFIARRFASRLPRAGRQNEREALNSRHSCVWSMRALHVVAFIASARSSIQHQSHHPPRDVFSPTAAATADEDRA